MIRYNHMNLGQSLPVEQMIFFYIIWVWSLLWKGVALWKAASLHQRNWFIVILILNTFGIIEIAYLFWFAKKRLTMHEIKHWFRSTFYTKKSVKE
jgi:Family of unknown function (DUF5652)